MFDSEDREYFARRASICREKESQATDPAIKKVHGEMALEYERRARGEAPQTIVNRL
ncbi:MAG: hypothetical protein KYX69_06150 [Sphingomonas sp.]|uniref:hypothetical protein n=1 Tax=Sphingomonas sp. TaxID=28214 RepID=UPI00260E10E1|nr:hypothetical protein [Sphingomonas sp.]MDK2767285.1 hypothetical protein [Sphingomonas sp.]